MKTLKKEANSVLSSTPAALLRERIVRRAALEFKDGIYGILCQNFYLCFMFYAKLKM